MLRAFGAPDFCAYLCIVETEMAPTKIFEGKPIIILT